MHRTRRLFLYGTLLPGEPRWPILEPFVDATTDATASGTLWDTGRAYPAARFADGDDTIPGVVVDIAPERWDEVIDLLDDIEGEGVLYRRLEVQTSRGPATSYEWLGPTDGMTRLTEGWRRT